MSRRAITLSVVSLLALAGTSFGQATERVSVVHAKNNRFAEANPVGGNASGGYTTSDGRYTVFSSTATNLVAGDLNGRSDVFVRDRWTNITVRISVPTPGVAGESNGDSFISSRGRVISENGRFVIFESDADNLVTGDSNAVTDIFVHDRDADQNGTFDEPGAGKTRTQRVNLSTANAQATGSCPNQTCTHYSNDGIMSADGRYVVWTSPYNFSADAASFQNVFWRDRDTDNDGIMDESGAVDTRLVSKRVQSNFVGQTGDGFSDQPALSSDGRHVAFRSNSRYMVFSDSVQNLEIFSRDMVAGVTARLTMPPSGNNSNQPDSGCSSPAISATGRYVAFVTAASNLATGTNTAVSNVMILDRDTDNDGTLDESGASAFEDVSQYPAFIVVGGGDPMTNLNGSSSSPSISDDGRYVCFASAATNFAPCFVLPGQTPSPLCGDTTVHDEVFVYDRVTDNLNRASVGSANVEPNADCSAPMISADGRFVTFRSTASNLDGWDAATLAETFVRTMWAPSNDSCETASPIAPGFIAPSDSYGARATGEVSCGSTNPGPAVWYAFTANCSGSLEAYTTGSPFDTVLTVYSGTCPATLAKVITCSDDENLAQGILTSRVTFNAISGQNYLIRVGGYGIDSGRFTLTLSNCTSCLADFNQSGTVTPQDIFDYLNAWFTSSPAADINGGGISPQDIFDYLNLWFAGC